MPNDCEWIESKENSDGIKMTNILCHDLTAKFEKNCSRLKSNGGEKENPSTISMILRPSNFDEYIMDASFRLFDLVKVASPNKYMFQFIFCNLRGFSAETSSIIDINTQKPVLIQFTDFELNFFIDNKMVRSCNDLNFTSSSFLFRHSVVGNYFFLAWTNLKFKTPICPLVLRNARIKWLTVDYMINSFYKKNVLSFDPSWSATDEVKKMNNKKSLNCRIELVEIAQSMGST